ncbi:MAG: Coenzyme F420 hydrogenase/dehydrogenase, beta subunit C-terminal domain [Clostridia bacterium]|nr:Coenzyme F420 hydrogenase/dehydrogenase, beta subunit C-terminal domain [Clostridia bacterium]
MIQLIFDKHNCFGCAACSAVCPQNAISMQEDEEGFLYPKISEESCIECGKCVQICNKTKTQTTSEIKAYALRCNDMELLQASSSGGAFSLLADAVLKEGGLVCGAEFDREFRVCHVLSTDIEPMRKSKYIQSDISDVYLQIEAALKDGKQVLFSGTPCQCDGMRKYFGENSGGLILAALICRGVQSPGLWSDYVSYISGNERLEKYCFRDKRVKNDGHTVSYRLSNNEESAVSMGNDPFSRLYMKCLTLRPSCYQCPYTNTDIPFDLTIGDFWGVEKVFSHLADGMGSSLVIARTDAAQALLQKVKPEAQILECDINEALQPALKEPAKETLLRKLLFRDYSKKDEDGRSDIPLILKKYGG